MSSSRIGILQFKPGTLDEAIVRARQGLLPIFQKEPGFISYEVIKTANDRGISISVWDTHEHAEAAEKRAADWIRQNTQDQIQSSDIFVGDVAFDSREQAGWSTIVQEMYDAFNRNDIDRAASFAAPNLKVWNSGFGNESGYREYMQNWIQAFPDGRISDVTFVEQDNRVVAELVGRGTHTGPLDTPMGRLPPTNRRVEARFVEAFEFRNGKVVAMRSYFDGASFLRQLGIEWQMQMPQKAAAPAAQPPLRH